MYDRILFPTDGRDAANAVFDHALDLAASHDATLHVLYVADTNRESLTRIGKDVRDVLERQGEEVVAGAVDRAGDRGIETVGVVRQGDPSTTIVEYADAEGIDLIAMATHGRRGLDRVLFGSVTERVVRQAGVPVLTVRPDDVASIDHPYRTVLVPTDGSQTATAALAEGIDVANAYGAALHVLSVVDPTSLGFDVRSGMEADAIEEGARRIVDEAVESAEEASVDPVVGAVGVGSVHRKIRAYVREHDVDLVVAGTHGRSGTDRLLLGSVAEKLIRTAPVPVLTVRRGD